MLAGIKSLFQNPKVRTWLFIMFTLLFYWTRSRPPEPINDIQVVGNNVFLAMGRTGIVVLDIRDRGNPIQVAGADTFGEANSVQVVENRIFVADGPDGVKVLASGEVDLETIGNVSTPGTALDLSVKGDNVFTIVDDSEDLQVYKINYNNGKATFSAPTPFEIPGKAEKIQISGNRAYISNDSGSFRSYDISSPKNVKELAAFDLETSVENFLVLGDFAYVAAGDTGFVILDISQKNEITKVGEHKNNIRNAQDVDIRGNYAYVATGSDGYFVLDISNFENIVEIGRESSPENAMLVRVVDNYVYVADNPSGFESYYSPVLFNFDEQGVTSGQGFFEDIVVKGEFAYVAAGDAGVKVVNVSNISAPQSGTYVDETNDYATALDLNGDYIYVTYRNKGLRQYSISENPGFPHFEQIEKNVPGEPQDVMVSGNMVYIASGSKGLQIVDLGNIAEPKVYAQDTAGTAKGVFVLGNYAYIADGGKGLQIIAINDPGNPALLQTINTNGDATSVFVAKLKAQNDEERTYAFIANGKQGLLIVDITDIDKPVNVATFTTNGAANHILVREQRAYLLTEGNGLMTLDISIVSDPKEISSQSTPGQARRFFLREDGIAFIADYGRGLRILDISDEENPQEISFFDVPVTARVLLQRFPEAYMVDGINGMWILDLGEDPLAPIPLTLFPTPGESLNLALMGQRAYIADGSAGMAVVDLTNLFAPTLAGSFPVENAVAVALRGSYAYVVTGERKDLHILDIENPEEIREIGKFNTAGKAIHIALSGGYAYISEGTDGIEVVNIQDPTDPSITSIGTAFNSRDARSIMFRGSYAFIADGPAGMKVFDMESPAQPRLVDTFSILGGYATSMISEGEYVFLAVNRKGIFPFNVLDMNNILYAGFEDLSEVIDNYAYKEISKQGKTSGATQAGEEFQAISIAVLPVSSDSSRRFINYTTSIEEGVQISQADGRAEITQLGMYQSPGEATFLQVIRAIPDILFGFLTGDLSRVPANVWYHITYMIFGTVLFVVLSFFYLLIFSQFVLPVQSFRGSFKAATRLFASLWGNHGPNVFVKEGKVIQRPGEMDRFGPGVARVDLNSAIVFEKRSLRTPLYRQRYNRYVQRQMRKGKKVPRARVEGPGVQFMEPFETIHGVADLRPQFRIRPGIQAYTRDGIEVSNPVWILFTLGQPPNVLDVTYDGERVPENLRVIHLSEKDIPVRETIEPPEGEAAQDYARYQITRRFFQKAKELVSQSANEEIEYRNDHQSFFNECINDLEKLAADWRILEVGEVHLFLGELKGNYALTNDVDERLIYKFVNDVQQLADRLLSESMANFYDRVYQGRKQRGRVVKQLTDELDPDDREEIHRYVQTQTEIRYFANVKVLASKVKFSTPGRDEVRLFLNKIMQLAYRWGIQNRNQVQDFIDCVSALVLELDLNDPEEVRWFGYYAAMLSDEFSSDRMIEYYDYLNREMILQYQIGLQELIDTPDLSNFARQSMEELSAEYPADDRLRLFNLNALELQGTVRPEFVENLEKLKPDPENIVEIDMWEKALAHFDKITANLVRTSFPFSDEYSVIASLRNCFETVHKIAQDINIRNYWRFPDFFKIIRIRRTVNNIQETIAALDRAGEPAFKRYVDLIKIYDYVQYIQGCVGEFRKLGNDEAATNPALHTCVANIKYKTQVLEQIQHPAFKRPVRNLKKWSAALSSRDPVYVFFFAKQVDELWVSLQHRNQIQVRGLLAKARRSIALIQREIRQFKMQSGHVNANGELRQYEIAINEIQARLENCKVPPKMIDPGSGGGEKIQVGPFQFIRRRVLAAIYSKALDVDQEGEYMPWTDLPVHAAAQTYRELVSREQYDYLYEPKDPKKFNLPVLKGNFSGNFSRTMRNKGILAFRFIDHMDGKPLVTGSEWANDELIFYEPRELKNPKVLRARGIKVIASGFPDMFPTSPKVPEQWLETWRAPLTSRAIDVRGQHQLQAMRVINQARAQAQRDMAHTLARIMRSSHSDEALAMRVFQALEATAVDKDARQFLPRDTTYLLRSFKQWFLPGGDDMMKSIGDLDFPMNGPTLPRNDDPTKMFGEPDTTDGDQ